MKAFKINTTEFTGLKSSDFVVNISDKVQGVGTNPSVFPSPDPSVAELQTANDSLLAKINAAKNGSTVSKLERNTQREIVTGLVLRLLAYVFSVASTAPTEEEKITIVEMAKFKIAKSKSPLFVDKVQDVRASWTGNTGEVEVRYKRDRGSHSYMIQKTHTDPANPGTVWEHVATITRTKYIMTGLQPLTNVWCRVIAVGANGPAVPSDPAMSIVG